MEREINGKLIKLVLLLLFPSWYFDVRLDCSRRSAITEIRSRGSRMVSVKSIAINFVFDSVTTKNSR